MHIYNETGLAAYFAYSEAKGTKAYQNGKTIFANKDDLKIFEGA